MRGLSLALALAAMGAAVQAQPSPSAIPELGVGSCAYPDRPPVWARKPTEAEVRKVYPIGAPAKGASQMNCDVGQDGGMRDCSVISEKPTGYGFGAATLKLAPLFRMSPPRCADGRLARGASIVIPLEWKFW